MASDQTIGRDRHTDVNDNVTLSPGVRGGWDIGEKQVVLGFAMPITWSTVPHRRVWICVAQLPFKGMITVVSLGSEPI